MKKTPLEFLRMTTFIFGSALVCWIAYAGLVIMMLFMLQPSTIPARANELVDWAIAAQFNSRLLLLCFAVGVMQLHFMLIFLAWKFAKVFVEWSFWDKERKEILALFTKKGGRAK